MDIYLSEADFQELLSVLAARGREADATEQARIESLIGRLYLSAHPKVSPANTESRKSNGGVTCDMEVGPCSCGAWHGEGKAKAKETKPLVKQFPTPNGLVMIADNEYIVYARSQDSTECIGRSYSLDKARRAWAEASILFGQKGVKPEDAKVFQKTESGYRQYCLNPKCPCKRVTNE